MLKLLEKMGQVNFGQLKSLYEEENRKNIPCVRSVEDLNIALMEEEQVFYLYLRDSFFQTDGALYAVWEEEGKYISALRLEPYKDGRLLEALETHPQYRRQGYAKKLVTAVLEKLMKEGPTVIYSHVRKNNSASLRLHLACGFQRILEQAVYIDGSVSDRACTMKFVEE